MTKLDKNERKFQVYDEMCQNMTNYDIQNNEHKLFFKNI